MKNIELTKKSAFTNNNLENKFEHQSLHGAFEYFVKKQPGSTALISDTRNLTYSDVNHEASCLARLLIENGVQKSCFIPIILPRSPDLVIAILAVLKAGAAYSLIDPSWPKKRIERIVFSLSPPFIITNTNENAFDSYRIINPSEKISDKALEPAVNPQSFLNYPTSIFFTSGTTGEPKGVISTHKGTLRLFTGSSYINLNNQTVMPLAASLPWDAFSLELWGALANGGTSWIVKAPYLTADCLRHGIKQYGVNTIWMTSSLFNMIVEEELDCFSGLEKVIIGGEKLSTSHVEKFINKFPSISLINGYGPVESTVFATTHKISFSDCQSNDGIPIGKPVSRTKVFVFDQNMRLCDDNELGEICIAGDGLSLGYLNDDSLTLQKFKEVKIDNQHIRIYCSGDLGYWKKGLLYIKGRLDGQVKIRGHRVEPSEIENYILKQYPKDISSCKVIVYKNEISGENDLLAFCLLTNNKNGRKFVNLSKSTLKLDFPDYMTPSQIIFLKQYPLTEQGKLDEKELLNIASQWQDPSLGTDLNLESLTSTEEIIVSFIGEITNKYQPSKNERFADSGLSSLQMGRLCSRLSKKTKKSISISYIYKYPTLKSFAAYIDTLPEDNIADNFSNTMNEMQLMCLTQHLIHPHSLSGRCFLTWVLEGSLCLDKIKRAIRYVHYKNETLHTKFILDIHPNDDQCLAPEPTFKVLQQQENTEDALTSLRLELSQALDPCSGLNWRSALVPIKGDNPQYVFGCAIHHIVFDGYSEHILSRDLSFGYANHPEKPIHSTDIKLSPVLLAPILETHVSSEMNEVIKNLQKVPELNFTNTPEKTREIHYRSVIISPQRVAKLDLFSQQKHHSCFELLFFAWVRALGAITKQQDFCIGIPVRLVNDCHHNFDTINCNINMIPPRINPTVFQDIDKGLEESSQILRRSLSHLDIPLSRFLQHINPTSPHRTPLYQTLFAYQDNPHPTLSLEEVKSRFIRQPYLDIPLEIHAEIWPQQNNSLEVVITYDKSKISNNEIDNLLEIFNEYIEKTAV